MRWIDLRAWLLNIRYEKRAETKPPLQWHSSVINPLAWAGESGAVWVGRYKWNRRRGRQGDAQQNQFEAKQQKKKSDGYGRGGRKVKKRHTNPLGGCFY